MSEVKAHSIIGSLPLAEEKIMTFGALCEHGNLARSCGTCELQAENARMAKRVKELEAAIRKYVGDTMIFDMTKEVYALYYAMKNDAPSRALEGATDE